MLIAIHPIPLYGEWDLGYALDQYVLSSTPIGTDQYGHTMFDNTYSDIASSLRKFKYRNDTTQLPVIVDAISSFLDDHQEICDFGSVIPVPPCKESRRKRNYQPTEEIAKELSTRCRLVYCDDVLVNNSEVAAKSLPRDQLHRLDGTIVRSKHAKRKMNVLLIDDTYRTGYTLNQCVKQLRSDPLIGKIYVITVTKNKNSY